MVAEATGLAHLGEPCPREGPGPVQEPPASGSSREAPKDTVHAPML